MGWADNHIKKLLAGETVKFRPHGNSMIGKINSGDLCTVTPSTTYNTGDIVLCKVGGKQYLHIVAAVRGARYKITNNKGHINGWTSINNIYGKCIKVEP